jgi:hypothetical protein
MNIKYLMLAAVILTLDVNADSSTLDAAIGGGIGGATGAAIGNELGGRDGAILGGALGAAVGTAVTTDKDSRHAPPPPPVRYDHRPRGRGPMGPPDCPPGQRKKGNCW